MNKKIEEAITRAEQFGVKICDQAARAAGWRDAESGVSYADTAGSDEHNAIIVVKFKTEYIDEDDEDYNLPADDVDAFKRELEARGIERARVMESDESGKLLVIVSTGI